jgi:ATP-dependent Clp protease adapter protein ClpS
MNEARKAQRAEGMGHSAKRSAFGVRQEIPFGLRPLPSALAAVVVPDEDADLLVDDDIGIRIDAPWKVVLYNDNIHTFDEVILQLQKAIGCSAQRAEAIAFEAHHRGKAVAYSGEFNECFRVMGVLREIQLVVEIEG